MITIYIHGCSTCGVNSVYVRKVQRYAESIGNQVDIKNSKYDEDARGDHARVLLYSGYPLSDYTPIVVEDGLVTRLREWSK